MGKGKGFGMVRKRKRTKKNENNTPFYLTYKGWEFTKIAKIVSRKRQQGDLYTDGEPIRSGHAVFVRRKDCEESTINRRPHYDATNAKCIPLTTHFGESVAFGVVTFCHHSHRYYYPLYYIKKGVVYKTRNYLAHDFSLAYIISKLTVEMLKGHGTPTDERLVQFANKMAGIKQT